MIGLTDRELQLLDALRQERYTQREIAARHGICERRLSEFAKRLRNAGLLVPLRAAWARRLKR